jgi:hypothetical protein
MTNDDTEKGGKSLKTKAVIDRIEDGGAAVVQLGDDKTGLVNLPAALLPDGASDGDHLTITVRLERDARDAAEERIKALQERLEKRSRSENKS